MLPLPLKPKPYAVGILGMLRPHPCLFLRAQPAGNPLVPLAPYQPALFSGPMRFGRRQGAAPWQRIFLGYLRGTLFRRFVLARSSRLLGPPSVPGPRREERIKLLSRLWWEFFLAFLPKGFLPAIFNKRGFCGPYLHKASLPRIWNFLFGGIPAGYLTALAAHLRRASSHSRREGGQSLQPARRYSGATLHRIRCRATRQVF